MQTALNQLVVWQPSLRLGQEFGYRFDLDQVEINAVAETTNGLQINPATVRLQLWACDPDAGQLYGRKIADLPVDVREYLAGGAIRLSASGQAMPPADTLPHTMVVGLADSEGIQDLAVFEQTEQFCHPTLTQPVGYQLDGDRITLEVSGVYNPRPADNLSGSLAIELWATNESYQGDGFSGHCVASFTIGTLAGQNALASLTLAGEAALPSVGTWPLALMLREWTGQGYLTRDYVCFDLPFVVSATAEAADMAAAEAPAESTAEPQGAAAVQTPEAAEAQADDTPEAVCAETAEAAAEEAAAEEAVVEATETAETEAPRKAKDSARAEPADDKEKPVVGRTEVTATVAAAAEPARGKGARRRGGRGDAGPVSVNHASIDELAAVKGVNEAFAAALIAGRPYERLEDTLKIKGMGKKTLERLRSRLSL